MQNSNDAKNILRAHYWANKAILGGNKEALDLLKEIKSIEKEK